MANVHDISAQCLSKEELWADSGAHSSLVYPEQWVHGADKRVWILTVSWAWLMRRDLAVELMWALSPCRADLHPLHQPPSGHSTWKEQQQWSHCWALCVRKPWEGSGFHPLISSVHGPLRQRWGEAQLGCGWSFSGSTLDPCAQTKGVAPFPRALKNISGILFLLLFF